MDSAKVQLLFAKTLVGDFESEEAWEAVNTLRKDGSREIFEQAAEWCHSDDPRKRRRAAAILCQLRRAPAAGATELRPDWMFREESYALITRMLESEKDPSVLDSVIAALGHLDNPAGVPLILRYQNYAERNVRFAVACALGSFSNDEQSISGLVNLTRDANSDVRDWAVFGLGVLGDLDSLEIREALFCCLSDDDEDVREEAAVGLAKRQDQRVIPAVSAMLEGPDLSVRAAEATAALLGLAQLPPGWDTAECRIALKHKFNLQA